MELNNMLISKGQAHSFAVSIYNDISKYIIKNIDKYLDWLFHEYKITQSINGITCVKRVPGNEYKLVMYDRH